MPRLGFIIAKVIGAGERGKGKGKGRGSGKGREIKREIERGGESDGGK